MSAITEATPSLLEDEEFVRETISPLAGEAGNGIRAEPPQVTVHRRRDDGRVVAEYRFGSGARLFAKLYPDRPAGAAAHRIHASLWANGLGEGSSNRVPEPVGYLADPGVLLLRAAPGEQLAGLVLEPHGLDAVRRAAAWLAALHASGADLDEAEDAAQGVLRLARRAASATVVRPDLEQVVRGLLETLAERYERSADAAERAVTHGRFSAEHVYVSPESVTVVDLDRAALADPSKDVGELLHRLRWGVGKRGAIPAAVDVAGETFVREYRRRGSFALTSLEYHWSFSVVWTLLVLASKRRPGKGWDERSGFLLAELDAIPRRVAELLGGLVRKTGIP